MLPHNHIKVEFGSDYNDDVQASTMFKLELLLRQQGFNAQVFKEIKGDDSKLRVRMTKEERAKL